MNLFNERLENNASRLNASKRLLLGLCAMLVVLVSSPAAFAQSPEIQKAFRAINAEQPTKGLTALEKIAADGNPSNLYYLGLAQLQLGQKDKAVANFQKGIAADDKNGLNFAGLGHVRILEKNPGDAKAQLDQALKVSKSKDVQVLKAVAKAYLADTKYLLDAVNVLNRAKGINGTESEVHLLLGDALLHQNKQNAGETVSSYERAAQIDPKNALAFYKIGKIYQQARSNDIAISNYEKAIAADPEFAPAYKELGEVAYTQKEFAKAVQMYEKYLPLTENAGNARFQYAFFLFSAKNYNKANEIFKEVTTNPNVPCVAFRYYAYSLTTQSKDENNPAKAEEARQIFDKYFKCAKPEDLQPSDYAYVGRLLLQTTPPQDSLANENFAQSLKLDSAQAEVLQLHGDTYYKRDKYPEAIAAYKQLMSLRAQPLSQDFWSIGRAYYYNKQFAAADSAFTQLAERQPTMTIGPLWAAKARVQIDSTGAQALANPMYEKVIERGSTNPEKFKKDLIDAYMYFASYYINIKPDVNKAKEYITKTLQLDPNHADAKEALKAMKG